MEYTLSQLSGQFVKVIDEKTFRYVDTIEEAQGVMFVCPLCFHNNNDSDIGVHSVLCWNPSVPQTIEPVPGRWNLVGTSLEDLSLVAGSSSILLTGDGCKWHGFITNGKVT